MEENTRLALGYIDKLHFEGHSKNGDCQIAACILAKAVRELDEDCERLKAGKFTKEEFNNLCHETDKPMTCEEFSQGCCDYQKKLFGYSPFEKKE